MTTPQTLRASLPKPGKAKPKARRSAPRSKPPAAAEAPRTDIYQKVTDQIIAAIEAGKGTRMPWHPGTDQIVAVLPVNVASQKPYKGINTLVLWATGQDMGYPSALWGTYKQWQEFGAQVRKGEEATKVVFWQTGHSVRDDDDDSPVRIFAREYAVFNAAQVDNYTPDRLPVIETPRIEHAETFFGWTRYGIHSSDEAMYSPAADRVLMPPLQAYSDPSRFYATLAHEATHMTGHESRCNRNLSTRFGSEAYAMEELVAELGAAFLCAELGLAPDTAPRPHHAAYLASWLRVLRGDKRAIFTAASAAQKAVTWMHEQQGERSAGLDGTVTGEVWRKTRGSNPTPRGVN